MTASPRAIGGAIGLAAALCLALFSSVAAAQDTGPSSYWFEIEALNPGLGPAPEDLRRATPQEALGSFIEAARDKAWDRAAHLLDLTGLDEAEQAATGPSLAQRLAQVVERKIWIDWGDISDRSDALLETASGDNPLAGKPRRSQRLGILEGRTRPMVLRLNRVKPGEGDPVWVFARETVDRVPELYAVHGPGWFERAMPERWNKRIGDLELRRWELVALPTLIVVALLLFLALRKLFGWLAQKAPWSIVRNAAAAARMPVAIVITTGLAWLLVGKVITFSGPVSTTLTPILLGLVILGVTLALLRMIDAVLDVVTERYVGDIDDAESEHDRQLYTAIYAFRRIVVLVAFVLGAGLLMTQLHLTETLGISLLASAGVLAVLLGIAGQTVLGNIFSSLQIALARPISIGDSVYYEGDWAYVESIFYTFVRLRTWDNRRLIVPVKYFVSNPFENWTMQDARMTRTFVLVLDHDADAQALREAFMDLAGEDEDAMAEEMTKMLVIGHDHNGQQMQFYATAADPSTAWNMHARLREAMIAWVRDNHPEWWPRERVLDASGLAGQGGAVGDAGG